MATARQELSLKSGIQRVERRDQHQKTKKQRQAVSSRPPIRVLHYRYDQGWEQEERCLFGQQAQPEAGATASERPKPPRRGQGQQESRDRECGGDVVQQDIPVEEDTQWAQRKQDHRSSGRDPAEREPPGQAVQQQAADKTDEDHEFTAMID